MKKDKKKQPQNNQDVPATKTSAEKVVKISTDDLRINVATGILTLSVCILLLYIIDSTIYSNYHPDIAAILEKVVPLTIFPQSSFLPEPVERMQFQLSIICAPIFIYLAFFVINKKRSVLYDNPSLALAINIAGLVAFAAYTYVVFQQNLLYVHFFVHNDNVNSDVQTTSYFFINDLIAKFNVVIGVIFYAIIAYGYYLYRKSKETPAKKLIVNIISYSIVGIIILDIILYNVFHLDVQEWGRYMETNAVFYSVTQVFAGKSLLVDINCQYGLYPWILCPLFKIIGLSTTKFTMTMGILNGISFFLIYLGIKKIIKQDILSLAVFMALIFWQFWQTRIPFEATPRYYYQYWPVRILFPAIAFYLVVIYQAGSKNMRRILLPVLSFLSALAIFWNLDTGIVVYGAVFAALLVSTLNLPTLKGSVKQCIIYAVWMIGALLFVVLLFFVTTKIKSGAWPDFARFSEFQNLFYISGYFMLPMSAIHFWNMPVLVYLIACVYCVYNLRKTNEHDVIVLAFLFVLGFGLFAYFQGRSYDMTLDAVLYPSIIILGILCNKLLSGIVANQLRLHERMFLFFIPFLFLADGAFSMLYYIPSIHSFSYENAFSDNPEKEKALKERIDFVTDNASAKDTVLILSKDFESYFYAAGNYYNPVNLAGSTEIFFKSEINTLVDFIKTTRYPIFYDATHPWMNSDTIVRTLATYTTIQKEIGPDHSFLLLKPGKKPTPNRLLTDANTIYYNNLGVFSKYVNPTAKLKLPENFTVEAIVSLDTTRLAGSNLMFTNNSKTTPFSGLLAVQNGTDLTQYIFTYGNGAAWCNGVFCKLSCTTENHIVMKVQKNMITVYNNDNLCGTVNTNSMLKNSDGIFFINANFAGTVHELKISNQ